MSKDGEIINCNCSCNYSPKTKKERAEIKKVNKQWKKECVEYDKSSFLKKIKLTLKAIFCLED